ncbi:hypothetical protein ASPBRDRAFT_45514 [Aspergillus brasiliensis CBS 101740]|uniref:Uncharacterized protein n=1 Tax=Aspergillus brasiliensis (strain CBS 101740 / IMI 381727 / IBT 21946) TaxID=767769 RepID=A0A1L9UEZ4_ASPBC|nr:hypothetical protein ASPBRDRAFT_45514 [Aspergillus brasiliensis CBS 101740]
MVVGLYLCSCVAVKTCIVLVLVTSARIMPVRHLLDKSEPPSALDRNVAIQWSCTGYPG